MGYVEISFIGENPLFSRGWIIKEDRMDKRAVVLLAQKIFRSYGELSGEAADRAMAQAKKHFGITDEHEEVIGVQGNTALIKYVLKSEKKDGFINLKDLEKG